MHISPLTADNKSSQKRMSSRAAGTATPTSPSLIQSWFWPECRQRISISDLPRKGRTSVQFLHRGERGGLDELLWVHLQDALRFTEFLDPFQRVIQPEEIWLYKNPLVQSDNIPTRLMFAISFLTPLAVILVVKIIQGTDRTETKEACLALSLALALNGVCSNTIKLIVGRWSNELRDALHW
ncbi:phospholipid phosphatase 4 [Rhinatrema bivittatum]|uniref:phospholipid phosphatase 4 n=1 Tax=Rhinatrema bivittatum TaxID=194408 RepID=UPI00112687EA|nr:phospholipid phosphatase 4 [Rhinatrema bivittatum]